MMGAKTGKRTYIEIIAIISSNESLRGLSLGGDAVMGDVESSEEI